MKPLRISLAAAAVALATTVAPVALADDGFLQVDGVVGDSVERAFPNAMSIRTFSFGISSPSASIATGMAGGKVSFAQLNVTKQLDKASAGLMRAAATGQNIPTVTLSLRRGTGPGAFVYYKVTLNGAVVTSYKISDNTMESAAPAEELSLNFARINVEVFTQGPDGRAVSAGKFGYDVATARPL
jgi:type VI secretion system secreted protein Hcp